jgi:predicted O-methyltransferase YrrM
VDAERFLRDLPALFRGFPDGEEPVDPRFAEIVEAVPGLARANNLALLNLVARCLSPGETYVEVGAFRGTSLIGAMLGNEALDFVAIDDFSRGDGGREQLERNLAGFGLDGRVTILEGDAFELLRSGALADRRIGAYYYDAAHTYEQQRDGLVLAEPYLVDGALVTVDDTDWDFVDAAVRDYLDSRPDVRSVVKIGGKDSGRPWWWEGVQVLEWRAGAA